ncbi:MAG: YihY family inner membrane protein [Gammaproteobacteria bacterium]|nr:YihY family inner membrane protein [Gammaproteobacteria bacterium]
MNSFKALFSHKNKRIASSFCRFWAQVCTDFYHQNGMTRAASLAYTILFAFVPLIIIIISMLSYFTLFDNITEEIEAFVFSNFVPHTGNIVLSYLIEFQAQAKQLPWISFGFLFFTAIMLLINMETHLNELWGLKKHRHYGLSILIHWGTLIIGPILLCVSLMISSYLVSASLFTQDIAAQSLKFAPFICSIFAYTFLYQTLPSCKVRFIDSLIGGLFSAILFETAKTGFVFYTEIFRGYQLLYGALATIPLFLLWLYCCALTFLFGGQVVNTLRIDYEHLTS